MFKYDYGSWVAFMDTPGLAVLTGTKLRNGLRLAFLHLVDEREGGRVMLTT